MVDFIKILKDGYFCIDLYGSWHLLPCTRVAKDAMRHTSLCKLLNFKKINRLELGLHTLNLSCLGN